MRQLSFIILFFMSTVGTAQTLTMVEQQTYWSDDDINPYGYVWSTHYTESQTGIWVFSLVTRDWGELMAGPNYTVPLTDSLWTVDVGIGGGIETVPSHWRTMAYVFGQKKRTAASMNGCISFLLNVEYGASGMWYLGYVTYNVSDHLAFGIHVQGDGAWGPKLQAEFNPLSIWINPGYNMEREELGVVTGIRLTY